jgi:murein DD-endopeptidase MepM/ murein hydrolase activator NlpD
VRATSPPPAPTVATAAIPLVAAVLALPAVPSAAQAERWLRPVSGEVARSFSYVRAAPFVRGAHRGADLAAAPGTTVRSACSGTVVHAGPVARQGRAVSVRCGTRRVSYLPLASVTVRAGAPIGAGSPLGTVAAGHGGLHVGVRRDADRFGYEDPMPLLAPAPPVSAPPLPAVRARPRAPVRRPAPPLRRYRPRVTVPRAGPQPPLHAPRPAARPAPSPPAVAPWPVWAGLAMLLAGATGSGAIVVAHRRRARRAAMTDPVARAA